MERDARLRLEWNEIKKREGNLVSDSPTKNADHRMLQTRGRQ
jgi:hypothetical protein